MSHRLIYIAFALSLLCGCRSGGDREPAIGEAFVGPLTLNLRKDLSTKSPNAITVKHGEKLDVITRHRSQVKVRTAQGVDGWTDARQLLTPEQMNGLRLSADQAARLPSQGAATVFEPLNMHTEPSRSSPSFYQIAEKESVQVIGHRVAPRVQAEPKLAPVVVQKRTASSRKKEKEKASTRIPPPPPPKPPAPPRNWLELSRKYTAPEPVVAVNEKPAEKPAPVSVPMDDWSLVRSKDGKAGWVLSRMITMSIPDEVAQYAEGHRITSYFQLGDVETDDGMKHNWLWTTMSNRRDQYEFDRLRVFVWSKRHHRYETAYVERNVKGFYPTKVHAAPPPKGKSDLEDSTFSVVVADDDGQLYRRAYVFNGYRVRMTGQEQYSPNADSPGTAPQDPASSSGPAAGPPESWFTRFKKKLSFSK